MKLSAIRPDRQSVKEFLWATLFLGSALTLAVFSSIARAHGQYSAAAFLAAIAILLAVIVTVTVIPKLLFRARIDLWERFRYFRLTKRGAFFLLLVLMIGLATINTGNNLLILILSFLLASLMVSGMVSNLMLHGLQVRLQLPSAIHAGQRAVFHLSVENLKKRIPSAGLVLRGAQVQGQTAPDSTDFFNQQKRFAYIRGGESVMLRLETSFFRRGLYAVEGFEVRTRLPFGFFSRGRKLSVDGTIAVYPRLYSIRELGARFPSLQGLEQMNRKGHGTGLYNIRDYQAGDDGRFVHWKSTGKLSRLMVKEFVQEEEWPLQLILVPGMPDSKSRNLERFESAVSVVASLIHHHCTRGMAVELIAPEGEWLLAAESEDYDQAMRYLAALQPGDARKVPLHRAGPRAIVFAAGPPAGRTTAVWIDFLRL